MTSVVISSKFRVVIPRAVRQQLKLKAGQRVHVRANEAGQVVFEPELDMINARGILPRIAGVDIAHIENDPEGSCSADASAGGGCSHGVAVQRGAQTLAPDSRNPSFAAECERQSLRIAKAEEKSTDLDAWMEEAASNVRGWNA